MLIATLIISALSLSLIILLLILWFLKHKNEKHDVRSPSKELMDFLYDMDKHGYGVIRVDPNNIFYRSPKELK